MQTRKHRIVFIIEDNKTENILLKLSLNSFDNITIHSFVNARELLNNLSLNPDIVIIDLKLPDMHGYELIKLIKEYSKDINLVVVSAQKEIEMIARIQEEGVYNYLVKSEGCLKYLKNIVEDIMILMDYKEKRQNSK